MGKLSNCTFYVANNKKVYVPGEKVEGRVSIVAPEDIQVKGVYVFLFGGALTKWTSALGIGFHDAIGKEIYFHSVLTLFGNKQNTSGPTVLLTKGKHMYRFSFKLPDSGIPSSFEGEYGAIRYWLKFEVGLPFPSFNKSWYRFFTVLAVTDVSAPEYKRPVKCAVEKAVSKAMGLGSAGKLHVKATLDRAAYCPGECMLVDLEIKNDSVRDLGMVKAILCQKVVYTAGNDTQTKTIDISVLKSSCAVKQGDTITWNAQPFRVDLIPASTKTLTSHIISVKYFVKLVTEVPLGFNIEQNLPVVIGTVPVNAHSTQPLQYKQCLYGISRFRHCDGRFVATTYVPWTCVVPPQSNTHGMSPSADGAMASPGKADLGDQTNVKTSVTSANAEHNEKLQPPQPSTGDGMSQPQSSIATEENWTTYLDAPPSYDEAVENTGELLISLSPGENGAILLIRFPYTACVDVKEFLTSQQKSLESLGGHLITFCTVPLLRQQVVSWPSDSSAALFFFGKESSAVEWFRLLSSSNQSLTACWDVMVAENYRKLPTPHSLYKVCLVVFLEITAIPVDYATDLLKKKLNEFGERYILRSNKPSFLQGNWSAFTGEIGSPSNTGADKEDVDFNGGDIEALEIEGEEVGSSTSLYTALESQSDVSLQGATKDTEDHNEEGTVPESLLIQYVAVQQFPDVNTYVELMNSISLDREAMKQHTHMMQFGAIKIAALLPGISF